MQNLLTSLLFFLLTQPSVSHSTTDVLSHLLFQFAAPTSWSVSSTTGADFITCGQPSNQPCKSFGAVVDQIQPGTDNVVFASAGRYSSSKDCNLVMSNARISFKSLGGSAVVDFSSLSSLRFFFRGNLVE